MVGTLIPWILDVSVIDWERHESASLEKLKAILDKQFEDINNELSMVSFNNVVKRWLKIEKSKLKARFMVGKKDCPINIEPTHWERLKEYWSIPKIEKKAEQMSNVKRKVTNMTNVGRTRKAMKQSWY